MRYEMESDMFTAMRSCPEGSCRDGALHPPAARPDDHFIQDKRDPTADMSAENVRLCGR